MFSFVSRSCTDHSAPARFVRSVPVGPPPVHGESSGKASLCRYVMASCAPQGQAYM